MSMHLAQFVEPPARKDVTAREDTTLLEFEAVAEVGKD
jgi:hypothetical protein